jgi:hypothetical protein
MSFYRLKITDNETGKFRLSFQKFKTLPEAEKAKSIFENLSGFRHQHLRKKTFEIEKVKK